MTPIRCFLTVTTLLIFIKLPGQVQQNKFKEEKVIYQYDSSKLDKYVFKKNTVITIDFDCCFNDSVEIFVNNQLIRRLFLKTENSLSFTGHRMTVMLDKKGVKTLKLVLPMKKAYCIINLDRRYRYLYVNRLEGTKISNWPIIFRNFQIMYE